MSAVEPGAATLEAWGRHLDARVEPAAILARLSEGSLPRAFAETAGARAENPALTIAGSTATHGELDDAAARIGGWLAARGVRPGDRVLIAGGTSHQLVRAYLGTLRCGATAMPVEAGATASELEQLLADAEPAAAFLTGDAAERLGSAPSGLRPSLAVGLEPGAAGDSIEDAERGSPIEPAGSEAPAILGYTSGTSGAPKGVPLSHANVLSSLRASMLAWRWGPEEVVVHALPLSHQHGLGGLQQTLLAGSHVVIEPRFEPASFCARVRELGATMILAVPSIYDRLARWEGIDGAGMDGLRVAISGSAPLPACLAERVAGWLGELPLERYGSTEAGLVLSNLYAGPRRAGRVGLPLPGIEVRLEGAGGGEAPEGEDGELLVRGPQVFDGYWRRPAETGESLDAEGWFRSGDLARIDPSDGSYAIVGRRKEMIISGGLNVFPAEVEAVLDQHPDVRSSAVAGVPSERWGEEVVAFVVPAPGRRADPEALDAHCRERLSSYKCPKRVIAIEELPTNQMGKVQRNRLVALAAEIGTEKTNQEED